MRRTPAIVIALLAAALAALPAAPAAAKGLVGVSVCGAEGCVDRSALLPHEGRDDEGGLLDAGTSVADPGRAQFVRLKLHIGDPATGKTFGHTTLVYLTTSGLVRAPDGTWHMPAPEAATLYKRAAQHVARFPARDLKPFEPPKGRVAETITPAREQPPARAAAGDGGGDVPTALLGAAAALVLAAGAAFVLLRLRRGRPATG